MKRNSIVVLFLFSCLSATTLNIQTVVDYAVAHHPSVTAAQLKRQAAEVQESYAYSFLWPTFALKGSYGDVYTGIPYNIDAPATTSMGLKQMGNEDTVRNLQTGYMVTMPLFNAGVFQGASMAKVSLESARVDEQKAVNDVQFAAVQAYYQAVLAQRTLFLVNNQLKTARQDIAMLRQRYASGVIQKTDLLRSEIQLKNMEQNVVNAGKNKIIAEHNLAQYVPKQLMVDSFLDVGVIPDKVLIPSYEDALATMYANRPEIKSFDINRRLALENYKLAVSDLFPTFQFVGTNYWSRNSYPDVSYEQKNWTMMAQGSWTLFNGLGNYQNMDMKNKLQSSVIEQEKVATFNYELELQDAYWSLQNAYTQLDASRAMIQLARENFDQVRARYLSGMDTSLNFIDAYSTLISSEINVAASEVSVLLGFARLSKVMGGSYGKKQL
jgi:outer membrane protein TolC